MNKLEKVFVFSLFCLLSIQASTVYAQHEVVDIKLWENKLPNSNGQDNGTYDPSDKNYKPLLRVYVPTRRDPKRRSILCFPGGGYAQTSFDKYVKTWVPYFMNQGMLFATLHYRVPKGNHEITLSDAYEAMRQMRLHAKGWNINADSIGIQGLSAGGHLASTLATHAVDSLRPAFQILIYPVISFDGSKPFTHTGSIDNFIGKQPKLKDNASEKEKLIYQQDMARYDSLVNKFSNERQVDNKTPRAFMAASDNDRLVMNSIEYYAALHKKRIPAVIHIYPSGGHGWHIDDGKFLYSNAIKQELKEWFESF